jgi:hypothetical protein
MKIYVSGTTISWILKGLGGPGVSKNPLQKTEREAPRFFAGFLEPPGPSRPRTSMISGSRTKTGFHDYAKTTLELSPVSPFKNPIGFGAIDVTQPFRFIGLRATDVTKPCKFIGFGATDVTKPYNLQRCGVCQSVDRARPCGRSFPGRLVGPSGWPKAGRRHDFSAFPKAVRPTSGPEGRLTARKDDFVTDGKTIFPR